MTVWAEIPSNRATALLLIPSPRHARISSSRGVSIGSSDACGNVTRSPTATATIAAPSCAGVNESGKPACVSSRNTGTPPGRTCLPIGQHEVRLVGRRFDVAMPGQCDPRGQIGGTHRVGCRHGDEQAGAVEQRGRIRRNHRARFG